MKEKVHQDYNGIILMDFFVYVVLFVLQVMNLYVYCEHLYDTGAL